MEPEVETWIKKIKKVKGGEVDLSRDEDLSIALMNLISLEEHFYFTAMKTENAKYLEMLRSVREVRKKLMQKIVTHPEGEEWCISKHLLATSMRLMEVGTKELGKGKTPEAEMFFHHAFELYSLFFAINLKLVDTQPLLQNKEVQQIAEHKGIKQSFSSLIKKIVDCCKEW